METDSGRSNASKEKKNMDHLTYAKLYQHSKLRGNIIRWYPITPGVRVLLVADSCETLEESLREMGAEVKRIPLEWENVGDAGEEQIPESGMEGCYDIVFQVDSFDAGQKKVAEAWKERLKQYASFLKEDGQLLLAVPNRLGLKYFAGCQDDVYDAYFAGPEGYADGMTKQALSRKEYISLLKEAGWEEVECYYPYPDYRFPTVIYSSEYLPGQDELNENIQNFDKDRYVFFEETKVYNSLLKEGLFEEFSNAFFFACRCMGRQTKKGEKVLYSKFSMERDERFQIRTDIVRTENGGRIVRKHPLTSEARRHLGRMEENYRKLQREAENGPVCFCPVTCVDGVAEFPWIKGEPLQQKLQKFLEQGDKEAAEQLILKYIEVLRQLPQEQIADVDLIFPNILVDDDVWNVIDYEWSFEEKIPQQWILYRTMLYLSIQLPGYETTRWTHLLELAGISAQEAKKYGDWEVEFQSYLRGKTVPLRNMVELLGNEVILFKDNQDAKEREMERRINLMEKDARKILFHLDQVEQKDGKAVLGGWACARTRHKTYIPLHITVFDQDGNRAGRAIERFERPDVAQMLKTDTDFPYWGFSLSFCSRPDRSYTLRLCAGRCQQEIRLKEISCEMRERN